jgi:hypothetical protein
VAVQGDVVEVAVSSDSGNLAQLEEKKVAVCGFGSMPDLGWEGLAVDWLSIFTAELSPVLPGAVSHWTLLAARARALGCCSCLTWLLDDGAGGGGGWHCLLVVV